MPKAAEKPRFAHRLALLALACVLLLACASPAVGAGIEGGSSFSELSQKAAEQETGGNSSSTATTTGTSKEAKNSKAVIFIGFGAAAVLLLGIAFVIVRDARRHTPETDPYEAEERVNHDLRKQQRERRAKAKAARQQRKRNR